MDSWTAAKRDAYVVEHKPMVTAGNRTNVCVRAGSYGRRVDDGGVIARSSAYIYIQAAADAFSGTVLIAKDQEVLLRSASGKRDIAQDLPMTVDTCINIGSITKIFTSVAITQLVEQGIQIKRSKFHEKNA